MNGNKTMKKTLGGMLFGALAMTLTMSGNPAYAQGGQTLSLPFCPSIAATENTMCIDPDNHQIMKFVKERTHKGFLGIGKSKHWTFTAKPLSSSELSALFNSYVSVSDASGVGCGGNGVCNGGSGRVVISGGNGGGNVGVGGGNGGGRVVVRANGNGNGGVVVGGGNGGNGNVIYRNGGRNGRSGGGNGRLSVADEYNVLNNFCGGVSDQLDAMNAKKEDLEKQVKDLSSGMDDLQKAVDAALAKVSANCRDQCITLATAGDGPCGLPPKVIAGLLSKDDLNNGTVTTYFSQPGQSGSQSDLVAAIGARSADQVKGDICGVVLGKDGKAGCVEDVKKNGMVGCDGFHDWLDAANALDTKTKALAQAKADLDKLNQAAADNCAIKTYVDAQHWDGKLDTASVACVEKMYSTCPTALAQYDVRDNGNGNCVNCGQNGGGGGVYTTGGGNGQVVIQSGGGQGGGGGISTQGQGSYCIYGPCTTSKAAQIISAIGGIGVPLGLGLMNMSMQNRSLNACVSNYAQMIELSSHVGLPPQASNCGLSYGMSSMGGMGMGGMGMGMGSMYPSMYPAGGMGMGMSGMGLYGSLGLGMGSMGMGMGSMYPSMYPAGGMGMGMGSMYPSMMGNMGMMGMYGNAMGAMQGNMMGVQQQMYNAQLQMQHMAAQNMALQNGMYGGGMGMGMGMTGMGMYGYPYYGMSGMYNPYSMYGGNGLSGSFGLNLNLGGNLGGGYYNPYMLYGM